MFDDKLDSLFPILESQAARLNAASDSANQLLATLEERLVDLNIGLEVWCSRPISQTDPVGDVGAHDTSTQNVKVLGFARVNGEWCLAVKPLRTVSGFYEGDMSCPYTNTYYDGEPVPLLEQSRTLRIAALQAMPKFLSELTERIVSVSDDLEEVSGQVQNKIAV